MDCSPPATPVSSPPNEIRRTSSTSGSTMANVVAVNQFCRLRHPQGCIITQC